MTAVTFYAQVVRALDDIGAPYMIVGAFGGYPFGISRTTYDIDILVDLRDEDYEALSKKFPLPRYYADPEMMKNSVEMGIMFNLIDTDEGIKADLVPLRREPEYRFAFERRIRREFVDPAGNTFAAWVAQPADIIIGKLHAWDEGRSNKHPSDIHDMLVFDMSGLSDAPIVLDEVTKAAAQIGKDTLEIWNQLVERAKEEIQNRKK